MSLDAGLLMLRVLMGVLFIGHGTQKLFGWFGGHGPDGTAAWLESQGIRPARFWAIVAGLGEAVGGLLFALGLFGPIGGLLISATMFVAIAKVHAPNGLWTQQNGYEYPLVVMVVALFVAGVGPGAYSLDRLLRLSLPEPETCWVGLVVVLLVAGAVLVLPSPPPLSKASAAH